jgi:hypothetical protein
MLQIQLTSLIGTIKYNAAITISNQEPEELRRKVIHIVSPRVLFDLDTHTSWILAQEVARAIK